MKNKASVRIIFCLLCAAKINEELKRDSATGPDILLGMCVLANKTLFRERV